MRYLSVISLVFLSISLNQTYDNYYEIKLTLDDPAFGQIFGSGLALNEYNAVIFGDSSLHFYREENSEWVEFQSMSTDEIPWNLNIRIISISNSLLVFCSGVNELSPFEANRIYINHFDGEFWQRDTVITINDMNDPTIVKFGLNLMLFEENILVTAETETTNRVYLFGKNGDNWETITYFEKELSEYFGYSMTMDDENICIGADGYSDNYDYAGAVYCYQSIGTSWVEMPILLSNEPGYHHRFGNGLILHDELLYNGETGDLSTPDFSGNVQIFQKVSENWNYISKLTPSDAEEGDLFGLHIKGIGSYLLISSERNDDGGTNSGSVYLFKKIVEENEINWAEKEKIISSDLAPGDSFGARIGLTENFIMVAAPIKDNFSGAVYIYDPQDTTLHANFVGDVRSGNAPVTVQFTSVPQGNPTTYEWDFNSDGFIDSTEPNPQFTYYIDGVYTVTLTVCDETGSDAEVKTDYIQVVSDILFGDVNGDGTLDVGDLVMYIDFVLGYSEPEEDQFLAGDVNYSGQIDIIDIVMVIDEILGGD